MNDPEALLHYLDILLKESNFTKAARELYISQPYLTQLIKRIEKKLGTKILNRDHVPFSLTDAGMIYYKYLENISYNDQQLTRKLAPFTQPNKKIIKLGIWTSLGTYLLPRLLPSFLQEHPNVEIQLFENSPRQNETNLLNGDIDCYIGQTPETTSRDLNYTVKKGEQYYVVIPQTSHFFQSGKFILKPDEIDLKEILQAPMVLSTSESAIRHQVNGLFQKFHIKPQVVLESKSIITATALALHGVGLTISSASILTRMPQTPINLLPINENLIYINFFIATQRNQPIPSTIKELIKSFEDLNLNTNI
ncbi:LysR family transcriptional regulator [Lactobacillus helveticus]|uniref:LysR family transcriptional regulator n=1 Tax=Lactobacillus helveticus TaxID=1587 RepID=UPI001C6504A3|nr:LysR family transcriptional regulator [Lactobacillus helveticus]MBW8013314.1 LysR family transcriptional regulator [Lactobacillus helveticus]